MAYSLLFTQFFVPDLLPFSQTVVSDTRNEVSTKEFHGCDG